MSKFAATTQVTSSKSRAEIEATLVRYGATGFMYGWQNNNAVISFEAQKRFIRFILPLPDKASKDLAIDGRGNRRPPEAFEKVYEQAVRQRWRALALAIKAKLECVASGITSFEDEFLSHIVTPNGATVGEYCKPMIKQAYERGKMQPLLLGSGIE
jgi:hypothetical protein